MRVEPIEDNQVQLSGLRDHVIIAGLGMTGQELARSLQRCGVPYVIVDLNPVSVRKAVARGEPAYYGDISSQEVLEHLGVHHAKELVVAINDPASLTGAIRMARRMAPKLHISARTRFLGDLNLLKKAGVNMVIPAELEAAIYMSSYMMQRHGANDEQRKNRLNEIRREYGEVPTLSLPENNDD